MGKPGRKVEITQLKHKKKRRKNNPSIGLINSKTEPLKSEKKREYGFDPHLAPELKFDFKRANIEKIIDKGLSGSSEDAKAALEAIKKCQDPYLDWAGKAEKTSFEVPTVSLHTHEKIDARAIIEQVRKTNTVNYEQLSLFKKEQITPESEAIDFYKHDKGWANRLIAGDSLLVMNSLLEKEDMGGKVQCIYIDPPYGIQYGSNFQPFTNKRDVKEKDEDLTSEPEVLKAFRDTWELGIHSYLTYMRNRLLLVRELLTESGSCFVQISDENVHLIRNLMDEIFGKKNFIANIRYKARTIPLKTKYLDIAHHHILWIAKDKEKVKIRKIFKKQIIEGDQNYKYVELEDGTRRLMTKNEHLNHSLLPKKSRVFAAIRMRPTQYRRNQDFNYKFKGVNYPPPGGELKRTPNGVHSWSTTKEGMKNLERENRLYVLNNEIKYILYFDDYPITPYNSIWDDTAAEKKKRYVVQTSPEIMRRCFLMTTDPGDVVFDPTCGSGTSSCVAEELGRRWITCDTSRVAITLTKQRLMTSVFAYYELKSQDEGISSGFQYKTVPHITLGSIANNEPSKEEVLYDQPIKNNKKARVTGPFTVEAVPSHMVQGLGENKNISFKYEWLEQVKKSGIKGKKGLATDMDFAKLEKISGFKYLHAEGETKNPRKVIISFGPEHSPLDKRHIELALKEIEDKKEKPDILVFAAFHFDPTASRLIDEYESSSFRAIQVQMNMDLQNSDLKKKASGNESFWLIGSPDVGLKNSSGKNKDEYIVEVRGWDYYNPSSGKIESGGKNKIAMWILDTDYDGRAVFPRQVFFPMSGQKDGWARLAKSLQSEIDKDLIEQYRGTESLPFRKGENKKVAIKIIDDRGIESLKVIDFPKERSKKRAS